eukprot:SAG11_NODE_32042_length_287_cov_0.335106_1_plen_24_part_10
MPEHAAVALDSHTKRQKNSTTPEN